MAIQSSEKSRDVLLATLTTRVPVPEPLSVSTANAVSSAFAPDGFVWKPLEARG